MSELPHKVAWKPGTVLYPLPVVMVGCGRVGVDANLITLAWTGIVCSEPPLLSVSIRPERHSHGLIQRDRVFTVNLPSASMARQVDWCGIKSGRELDEFTATGLTPLVGPKTGAPLVAECPVGLECKLLEVRPLGSHDLFLAEIVAVYADDRWIDPLTGAFALARSEPLGYAHGKYYQLGKYLGFFGFSVAGKKGRQRAVSPKAPPPGGRRRS